MNQPAEAPESDEAIVALVLAGDKGKFDVIIERYQDRVFHLVRRLVGPVDAADVAQDAFLAAYLHLDQFDPSFRFTNWMLRIAQRRALNHLRHRGTVKERLTFEGEAADTLESLPDERPLNDPAGVALARDATARLEHAIARLPEKYRLLLHLRHTEGRQSSEIAEIIGIPTGTVKFRFFTLYRLLRDILAELEGGSAMSCREFADAIAAELAGFDLPADLAAHERECATCRALRQSLVSGIRAIEAAPRPSAPPRLMALTAARIAATTAPWENARPGSPSTPPSAGSPAQSPAPARPAAPPAAPARTAPARPMPASTVPASPTPPSPPAAPPATAARFAWLVPGLVATAVVALAAAKLAHRSPPPSPAVPPPAASSVATTSADNAPATSPARPSASPGTRPLAAAPVATGPVTGPSAAPASSAPATPPPSPFEPGSPLPAAHHGDRDLPSTDASRPPPVPEGPAQPAPAPGPSGVPVDAAGHDLDSPFGKPPAGHDR